LAEDFMSRRRTLTQGERALWTYVTRHVSPFAAKIVVSADEQALLTAEIAPPPPPPKSKKIKAPVADTIPAPTPPPKTQAPPPLVPLERRLRQRLSRGAHPIEAVLDLHGLRQEEAHYRLRGFLRSAQASGAAVVLVVTGKGGAAVDTTPGHPGERGVLRRVVPHWLRMPDLRGIVLGFEEAAQHHGGGGALYIRLRKRREP
jgi:DNA-nicking Smr family endonuclease